MSEADVFPAVYAFEIFATRFLEARGAPGPRTARKTLRPGRIVQEGRREERRVREWVLAKTSPDVDGDAGRRAKQRKTEASKNLDGTVMERVKFEPRELPQPAWWEITNFIFLHNARSPVSCGTNVTPRRLVYLPPSVRRELSAIICTWNLLRASSPCPTNARKISSLFATGPPKNVRHLLLASEVEDTRASASLFDERKRFAKLW